MSEILRGGNPGGCFFIRRAANIEKGVFSFMNSLVGPGLTEVDRAFLRMESPGVVVGFC